MERKPVGFGLIGTGMAGGFSARELEFVEGGFLAAVCSRDPEGVRAFAAEHGNPRAHTDYRELIADPEVDVVIITSPTGLHAEMTLAAADAGKHVLVEKPLEATVEAGERMVEHCRKRGVRLGVIFQMRFGRVADKLRELLGGGGLGEIWLADAFDKASRSPAYYRKAAWRGTAALEGGGCLMTQSIHIIDLLQHLVGPVASVIGRTATRRHNIEVEDLATALLRFENGAMGVVESTTAIRPALRSRLEIHGSGERWWRTRSTTSSWSGTWKARPGRRGCPRAPRGLTRTIPGPTRRRGTGCSFRTWPTRCGRAGTRCSPVRKLSARYGSSRRSRSRPPSAARCS